MPNAVTCNQVETSNGKNGLVQTFHFVSFFLLFRLAISDGYRAIALKPNWGKAYYRQAEAFREDNRLPEAIFCNERGLLLADDESEKEELRKQKIKFCGLKPIFRCYDV